MTGRAYRWATPLVIAAAGLLFVTSAENADGTDLRGGRYADLADLVRAASSRADRLADQVADLQSDVDALAGADRGGAGTQAQVARLGAHVGLRPVRGLALTVTLDDAQLPDQLPDGTTVDDYLVHQQDVEGVLNALWAGGATGVTVMDQRIVATSAVRCVGPVLLLQGRTYYPPYRMTAVGDVARLRASLDQAAAVRTYREWADALGLGFAVTDLGPVELPGYTGPLRLPLATPVPAPGS